MDESHLLTAVQYVLTNPVRVDLCGSPFDWPWSSASAHLHGVDDALVTVAPISHRVSNWNEYLRSDVADGSLWKDSKEFAHWTPTRWRGLCWETRTRDRSKA